jgi:PBP1b-binding outer membrane lipoprotein LpoB
MHALRIRAAAALGLCALYCAACSGGDKPPQAAAQAPAPKAQPAAKAPVNAPPAKAPVNAPPAAEAAAQPLNQDAINEIFAALPSQDQCDLEVALLIDSANADLVLDKLEQEVADKK